MKTLAEQFLILAHRPDKPGYYNSHQIINIGLIGALLLDLADEKSIEIRENSVEVIKRKTEKTSSHQDILDLLINSPKKRSVKRWVSRLSNKGGKFRKSLLYFLEKQNTFAIERKKFLGVNYINAQLLKTNLRKDMINDYRGIVLDFRKPNQYQASMLSLIKACSLTRVFCQISSERRTFKKNLKQVVEKNEIAGGVDKVIQEMQAAIVAATIASTTAATVSTN